MSLLLAKRILQLFMIIFAGFILTKSHVIRPKDGEPLSKIVLYLIVPACVISSFRIDLTSEILHNMAYSAVASVAVMFLLVLAGHAAGKLFGLSTVEKASVAYSNAGNLIIPLVQYVYSREWIVYVAVFFTIQLVFMWSHLAPSLAHEKKIHVGKILRNPNMIAVGIGLVLMFTGIPLPESVGSMLETLGDMIGPLCMLMIGITMAGADFRNVFSSKKLYLVAVLRLLVCPLVFVLLFRILKLYTLVPAGKELTAIMLLAVAAPSASSVVQFALLYGEDSEQAGAINVMTTLLCIVTMPAMTELFLRIT